MSEVRCLRCVTSFAVGSFVVAMLAGATLVLIVGNWRVRSDPLRSANAIVRLTGAPELMKPFSWLFGGRFGTA